MYLPSTIDEHGSRRRLGGDGASKCRSLSGQRSRLKINPVPVLQLQHTIQSVLLKNEVTNSNLTVEKLNALSLLKKSAHL